MEDLLLRVKNGEISMTDAKKGVRGIIAGEYPVKSNSSNPVESIYYQKYRLEQIAVFRKWGRLKVVISKKIIETIKDFKPRTKTELLILVPYFPGRDGKTDIGLTICSLFQDIDVKGYKNAFGGYLSKGGHLIESRLKNVVSFSADECRPGIKLVAIDTNAFVDFDNPNLHSPDNFPSEFGSGIASLAAALFYPEWFEKIKKGKRNPQPMLPSLQIKVEDGSCRMLTLGLNISNKKCQLVLGTSLPDKCEHFSLPTARIIAELEYIM